MKKQCSVIIIGIMLITMISGCVSEPVVLDSRETTQLQHDMETAQV